MAEKYILYTHHDSEITSVTDFVVNLGLSIIRGWDVQELLDYVDDKGKTNNQRIYDQYNRYEKTDHKQAWIDGKLDFLKVNTILALPRDKIFKETLAITGKNQIADIKSFEGFYAEQLITLLKDDKYKRSYKPPGKDFDTFSIEYPDITVWLWCRSLSTEDSGELQGKIIDISPFIQDCRMTVDKNGGNFSITLVGARGVYSDKGYWEMDFQSLSQYFTEIEGASFVSHQSIRQKDLGDKWHRTTQFINMSANTNDVIFIRFETLELEQQSRKRKGFEISKNEIPSNPGNLRIYDMIGLLDSSGCSFEAQGNSMNISLTGKDLSKLLIDDGSYFYPLQFAQNVFINPDENNKLIKRLATDGQFILQSSMAYRSIRYTLQYIINHLASMGITPDDLWTPYGDKRTKVYRLDNDERQNPNRPSSPKRIKLQNLEKLMKTQIITEKKRNQTRKDEIKAYSLTTDFDDWTQAEIDEWIRRLPSQQGNFATDEASVQKVFSQIQSWMAILSKTNDVIEFGGKAIDMERDAFHAFEGFTTTNEDAFGTQLTPRAIALEAVDLHILESAANLTLSEQKQLARELATTSIANFVASGTLSNPGTPNSILSRNAVFNSLAQNMWEYVKLLKTSETELTEDLANGIWQIIKLVIDENASDRRMSDPSISQPDGSLMNQFRKICQEPFVEFFTDTYEDLFYFIVRQPPFTKEAVISFLEGAPKTEFQEIKIAESFNQVATSAESTGSVVREVTVFQDITITIREADVFTEDLNFSDEEVYSFYELKPVGLFAGKGSEVSLAYIPIVYFPQYADIWGTRRLSVVSNYLPYNGLVGTTAGENTNYIVEQAAIDLKFIIDTNCYLPFTRKGSITMNGDRRIKRGTFIRYEATGEIFYVDAVTHFFSINQGRVERTTTLQLSRGMIEEYVRGRDVEIEGETVNVSYFNIVDTTLIKDFIVSSLTGDTETETNLGVQLKQNFGVNDKVFNFFVKRRQFSYK